jgi:hypothetical protein
LQIGRLFGSLLSRHAKAGVKVELDQGTFAYEGAQGTNNDAVSVWEFSLFGGLKLGGGRPAKRSRVSMRCQGRAASGATRSAG